MKPNNISSLLRLSILGAVDGLLFGAAVEVLRRVYTPIFLDYYTRLEIDEALRNGRGTIVSRSEFVGGYVEIPLLCMLIFALIIPLAYSLFEKSISSPLELWQLSGMVAVTVTVIVHNWLSPSVNHPDLLSLHWRWLFCLPIVTFINLVYGFIVGSVAPHRSHGV